MAGHRLHLLVPLLLAIAACGIDRDFRPGPQHEVLQTGARPVSPSPPDSLLVVSYNIQYGEDVAEAVADLRRAGLDRPDILLLQEMTPEGVDTVATALGLHGVYHPAAVHPHHGRLFGNAVLSPWPITGSELVVLPHPHPWSGHRRIAVAADLDVAGRPVRAVSLHLATAVVAARQRFEQAVAVVDSLVLGTGGAVVVGGDFNTSAPNDIIAIRKHYRRSARLLPVHLPPECTVRWHVWRILDVGCRLDHLFLSGLDAGRSGIATGATASDHFPIWARVGWRER
jgi:endonuclease/exonuclease/phosphatase family metal-dependent hydrolase